MWWYCTVHLSFHCKKNLFSSEMSVVWSTFSRHVKIQSSLSLYNFSFYKMTMTRSHKIHFPCHFFFSFYSVLWMFCISLTFNSNHGVEITKGTNLRHSLQGLSSLPFCFLPELYLNFIRAINFILSIKFIYFITYLFCNI